MRPVMSFCFFFFFNDTATTEIYTLSLHDALPILTGPNNSLVLHPISKADAGTEVFSVGRYYTSGYLARVRSEEHTSELQSRLHLVCRLLLEKKKKNQL